MSNINNNLEKEIQYWSALIQKHKESNNVPKKRTNDSQYRWEKPATSNKRVKLTSPQRHSRKFAKSAPNTPPTPVMMAQKTGVLFSSKYKWSKDVAAKTPAQIATESAQNTSRTAGIKSSRTAGIKSSRKLDNRNAGQIATSTAEEPTVNSVTSPQPGKLRYGDAGGENKEQKFFSGHKNYKNASGKVFQRWSPKQRTRNRLGHSSATYTKVTSNPYKLNRAPGKKTEQSLAKISSIRLRSTRVIDRRLRSHKQVHNAHMKKATSGLTPNRHHITVKQALARSKRKAGQEHHCIYFGRFGKCIRGDDCKFIHDPSRIAVCTRFLRGTCRNADCSFSHKIIKEKTPLCLFFLRGNCSLANCPYLHVYLGKNAPVCRTFATTGYCSKADKCKMQHIKCCPDYYESGQCLDENRCKLPHIRRTVLSTKEKENLKEDGSSTTRETVTENLTAEIRPSVSSSSSTPDFLSLEVSSPITMNRPFTGTSMYIKPRIKKLNCEK